MNDTLKSIQTIRKDRLIALFPELLAQMHNNDSGEFIISWKRTDVRVKFSHWISSDPIVSKESA